MSPEEQQRVDALFEHSKDRPLWPDGTVEHRAELLTPRQFVALLHDCPVLYVPFGSIAWHERHLPLGNDALKAHGICLATARRTGGIVHPTVCWGVDAWRKLPGGSVRRGMDARADFPLPGSVYQVGDKTFRSLVEDIVTEALRSDFEVVILFAGHNNPQQDEILKEVAAQVNRVSGTNRVYATDGLAAARKVTDWTGGHASRGETALMMALRPELVHMDELPEMPGELTGCVGPDPRQELTDEQAAECLEAVIADLAAHVLDLVKKRRRQ